MANCYINDADADVAVVAEADTTRFRQMQYKVDDVTPDEGQLGSSEVELSMGHAVNVQGILPILDGGINAGLLVL